jgi:hypothetical protein
MGFITLFFWSFTSLSQTNSADFFNIERFIGDTLYIKAQYIECGEFGGHSELTKVYTKGNDFFITYQKFRADCEGIKENHGRPPQILIQTISNILLNDDKLIIRRYLHQLLEAKIREAVPLHSGLIFHLTKSDDGLNIFVFPGDMKIKGEYEEFISRIIE